MCAGSPRSSGDPAEVWDIIQQKLRYINRNPVEEGLVEEPHHYLYSSARDEAGLPGMLKLSSIWGEAITDRHTNMDQR
jgi:hypothetical protein